MPSTASKRNEALRASYAAAQLVFADAGGEAFHPSYKKDKASFVRLTSSTLRLQRWLGRYFSELSGRLHAHINWSEYEQRRIHAADLTQDDWETERVILQLGLVENLETQMELGGQAAEAETGVTIGWSSELAPAQKALRAYTLKLSGDLTETTVERVKQSLLTSIDLGLNQTQALEKVASVIDDPYRAAVIAHTETVRAYSKGRLAVGYEIGAKAKVWDNGQPGACAICTALHGKTIPIGEDFETSAGMVSVPPAHPWCRCAFHLEM